VPILSQNSSQPCTQPFVPPSMPAPWVNDVLPGTWFKFPSAWVGEVTIEPEGADTVIQHHNGRNRPVGDTILNHLSKILRLGEFLFTGETIIFDSEGQLINGQHRLRACIKTKVPLHTFVVFGVDPRVFRVLDQHSKRTAGQVLSMMDEKNATLLAACVSAVRYFYLTGIPNSAQGGKSGVERSTIDELIEGLDKYQDIRESVAFCKKLDSSLFKSGSMMAAMHWIFSRVQADTANEFFTHLTNATIPTEDTRWQPLQTLYRSLLEGNVKNKHRQSLNKMVTEAYTVKTWNGIVRGDKVKQLVWRDGEDFPRVVGWTYTGKVPVCPAVDKE
jgi:hypothetical protein